MIDDRNLINDTELNSYFPSIIFQLFLYLLACH